VTISPNPIKRATRCHSPYTGSYGVTCHPTQVNSPRLTSARKAGTRFTYRGVMEGWVDWWLAGYIPRWFTCQQTVTHPRSNRSRCWATALIETNVLATTPRRHPNLVWILLYNKPRTNRSNGDWII